MDTSTMTDRELDRHIDRMQELCEIAYRSDDRAAEQRGASRVRDLQQVRAARQSA